MNRWNSSSCNTGGVNAPSFPYFTETPPEGSTSRTINVVLTAGFNPNNDQSCGNFAGNQVSHFTQARKPNGQIIECTSSTFFPDSSAHELGHTIGLQDQYSAGCVGYAMSQLTFNPSGEYQSRTVRSSECEKARDTNKTPSEVTPPPTPWCFSDSDCGGSRPYCALGSCVECKHNFHCGGGFLTIPSLQFEGAGWACVNYVCVAVSPLAIYLPDYLSSEKPRDWWWHVCDPDAPPVCLDWWDDGHITCSTWLGRDNEDIAFIAVLSEEDLASVQAGGLQVVPARHLFGNVTRGPGGDYPFRNGFEALASFCSQFRTFEIDLSVCGAQLVVWADNGDGVIAADELQEFDKFGVQSLGEIREVLKSDACGNLDLYESSAKCYGQPDRCGTWIDIFFAAVK